jgi:ring-1,2-phenylacetyl-CoA epoxidase subunit PaaE
MLTESLTKPLKVLKKIRETADAYSFVFEIPSDLRHLFTYRPGQFVTLFLNIDGQEVRRSYSLSTSPLTDADFKITVKKIAGGRGSTYLVDRVREGDTLRVTPPTGTFFSPPRSLAAHHYRFFAAGSGITPIFSILKSVLFANVENVASLLYLNRTEDSIIYRGELEELQKRMQNRLHLVHQLSRPSETWQGLRGRLSPESFEAFYQTSFADAPKDHEAYLCGPVEFMNAAKEELRRKGWADANIHIESFGESLQVPAVHEATATPSSGTVIGPGSLVAGEKPKTLRATVNGETFEVPAVEGQSILETLLSAGHNVPYSCMEGACLACLAKVEQGRVSQGDPGILTDDNIRVHEALTCQAIPLTSVVQVNYDNL